MAVSNLHVRDAERGRSYTDDELNARRAVALVLYLITMTTMKK